jgi:hypothetical protein
MVTTTSREHDIAGSQFNGLLFTANVHVSNTLRDHMKTKRLIARKFERHSTRDLSQAQKSRP